MGCNNSSQDIKTSPSALSKPPSLMKKQSAPISPKKNNAQLKKADLKNFQLVMLGLTKKGPTILALTSKFTIQTFKTKINFPRFSNAILLTPSIGYLTGGVQDLEVNVNDKATIDFQILQGVVSKKCIKVDISILLASPDDAFEDLPQMSKPRYAHSTVILNDKLYVIGGRQYGGDQNSILSSCQTFDLKSKTWINAPSLQVARSGAAAIIFGQHIYLFGGCTSYNARTKIIQSYSQGDDKWRKLPFNLPQGLQYPAILKKKDSQSILIFGGKTDYGKSNSVVELDFNKSTILSLSSMQQQRCSHKIAQNADQIYLIGGGSETIQIYDTKNDRTQVNYDINYLEFCSMKQLNSFSQFQSQVQLSSKKRKYETPNLKNKVFIFGHAHEAFSKIIDTDKFVVINDGQNLNHNFHQFTTVVKVNKEHAFILGGINSDCTEVTDVVYSFNLNNQQIKYLEPMKTARYGFPAIVKGSYLYVIGGRKIGSDQVAILNQCERFSFQSYKWEQIAPLKNKRHSAFCIVVNDYIVSIGGYKGNGSRSSDIQIYIQQQNRWVQLDNRFQLALQAMTPVVFEQTIYLFGGRNQSNDIQKVFKLKPEIDQGVKYQRCLNFQLEPVGNLSFPGTNLKIFVNSNGIAYVFGNIQNGIDVYDIKKNKVIQREQLVVFQKLKDKLFQSYTIIF